MKFDPGRRWRLEGRPLPPSCDRRLLASPKVFSIFTSDSSGGNYVKIFLLTVFLFFLSVKSINIVLYAVKSDRNEAKQGDLI